MIKELDVVTLTHDLEAYGLSQGSRGAVVHCYSDGQGFEVEFPDDSGDLTRVVTLQRSDIQLEQTMLQA